ncbi:MAG: hypothetical protein WB767_01935 [Nocardioides sp.]
MSTSSPVLSISVPQTWRRRADPAHGVLVAARAPTPRASGFRPEIVARCVLDPGPDLSRWRLDALGDLADVLDDFALEDDDEFDLLGQRVAYARFAHRCLATDVICEQWAWLRDGVGITLTCSVAREDYADYCDLFETVAESVELGPAAA